MPNQLMTQDEIMQNEDLFISTISNDIELLRSTAFDPQNDLEEFFLEEFCITKDTMLVLYKRILQLEKQVATLKSRKSIRISANADLDYDFEDEFNNDNF